MNKIITELTLGPVIAATLFLIILLIALIISGIYFGIWTFSGAWSVLNGINPGYVMFGALAYMALVMFLWGMSCIWLFEDKE